MIKSATILLGLCASLAACGRQPDDDGANANEVAANSTEQMAPSSPTPSPAGVSTDAAFSIETVPVSDADLGAFPRFGLPTGYKPLNEPVTRTFDQIPMWTGKGFRQVAGKTYSLGIQGEQESTYSAAELKTNMEAVLTAIGAVRIFEGKVARDAVETLPQAQRDNLQEHYSAPYSGDESQTWVVRRRDKTLWINLDIGGASSHMIVVEEKPVEITAKLLPAATLRTALDQTGKAVIHVNFATDQATILPESKAQVDAVAGLLKSSPTLRLDLNGYTDETGTPARNLVLAQARADAVMATIVAAGIDKSRLRAKGFGKADPVSPNTDEAGKARNRRVELVKAGGAL